LERWPRKRVKYYVDRCDNVRLGKQKCTYFNYFDPFFGFGSFELQAYKDFCSRQHPKALAKSRVSQETKRKKLTHGSTTTNDAWEQ
jgi:hypothetical protein